MKPDASNITIKFRYKHQTNVLHQLNLIDYQTIAISYNDTNTSNQIVAPGHLFVKILSNFLPNDSEISLEIAKDKATIRNYDASNENISLPYNH